jgi:trehalose-6-phosphate synthase
MRDKKCLVAALQLPFVVQNGCLTESKVHLTQTAGVRSLDNHLWFGWIKGAEELNEALLEKNCILVQLKDAYSGHYDGYCKQQLWPLLHAMLWDDFSDGTVEASWWKDYVTVNQSFADTIYKNYQEGDVSIFN